MIIGTASTDNENDSSRSTNIYFEGMVLVMEEGADLVAEGLAAVLAGVPLQVFLVEAVFDDVLMLAVGIKHPPFHRTIRNSSAAAALSANRTSNVSRRPRPVALLFCFLAPVIGAWGI